MSRNNQKTTPQLINNYVESLKKRILKDGRKVGMTEAEIHRLQADCEKSILAVQSLHKKTQIRF